MVLRLSRFIWIIPLFCFLAQVSLAGPRPGKMTSVRITSSPNSQQSAAGWVEMFTHITRWFESQGVKVEEKTEWTVWINARTIDESDTNTIILSVGLGHALPKEAIELGKQSEVFYSSFPATMKASLTKEGKWVREYITEGYLYEFVYPLDEKLAVVSREKLLERLDQIVSDLCERQLKG